MTIDRTARAKSLELADRSGRILVTMIGADELGSAEDRVALILPAQLSDPATAALLVAVRRALENL